MNDKQKYCVERLRDGIPDSIDDDMILKAYAGSYLLARLELEYETRRARTALREAFRQDILNLLFKLKR